MFRIQDVRRGRRSRKVVHFDRLKPCPSTVRFPLEHTTPKNHTVKQTAAPEYTDQPAPHLPGSELQFFDGEDLEQTDPGVDTNPQMPKMLNRKRLTKLNRKRLTWGCCLRINLSMKYVLSRCPPQCHRIDKIANTHGGTVGPHSSMVNQFLYEQLSLTQREVV